MESHIETKVSDLTEQRSSIYKSLSELKGQLLTALERGTLLELEFILPRMDNLYRHYHYAPDELKQIQEEDFNLVLASILRRMPEDPLDELDIIKTSPALIAKIQIPQLDFLFQFVLYEWHLNLPNCLKKYLEELGERIRLEEIELAALLLTYGANEFDSRTIIQTMEVILNASAGSVQAVLDRMSIIGRNRYVEFSIAMQRIVIYCFAIPSLINHSQKIPNLRLLCQFVEKHNIDIKDILSKKIDEAILKNYLEIGALLLAFGAQINVDIINSTILEKFITDGLANSLTTADITLYKTNIEETTRYFKSGEFKYLRRDPTSVLLDYLFRKPETNSIVLTAPLDEDITLHLDKETKPVVTSSIFFQLKETKLIEAKRNEIKSYETPLTDAFNQFKDQLLSLTNTKASLVSAFENYFKVATHYVTLQVEYNQLLKPALSSTETKDSIQNRSDLIDLFIFMKKNIPTFIVIQNWVPHLDSDEILDKYTETLDKLYNTPLSNPQCPVLLKEHLEELDRLASEQDLNKEFKI